MSETYEVCWDWGDNGNVVHIAAHNVTPDEVEQVLAGRLNDRRKDNANPGRWIVLGFTERRRFLKVVFEIEWVTEWSCWGIFPVTAFEPD